MTSLATERSRVESTDILTHTESSYTLHVPIHLEKILEKLDSMPSLIL